MDNSKKTFGVSGLLNESASIYYYAVFNSNHLGAVSDLLSIQFKKDVIDELRLRSMVTAPTLATLRLLQEQSPSHSAVRWSTNTQLPNPILLECGIDSGKLAIGLSFALDPEGPVKVKGLLQRILERKPGHPWEEALLDQRQIADQIILKVAPALKKAELVMVGNLEKGLLCPTPLNQGLGDKVVSKIDLVEIPDRAIEMALRPIAYVNLKAISGGLLPPLEESRPAQNETDLRTRNEQLEKIISRLKEEVTQLKTRTNDMADQLKIAKNALSRTFDPRAPRPDASSELRDLQGQYNALSRNFEMQSKRLDELKKANHNLMEHLNDPKTETIAPGFAVMEKMKSRLESAMQLLAKSKKQESNLQNQIVSLQNENEKIKGELAQLRGKVKLG